MHATTLFLGGHRNGLRYPTDRDWREHGRLHVIPIVVPDKMMYASFAREEPADITAPMYKTENYVWYDFGAFDCGFMILAGLDAFEALSTYLRGEPIL